MLAFGGSSRKSEIVLVNLDLISLGINFGKTTQIKTKNEQTENNKTNLTNGILEQVTKLSNYQIKRK